MTILAVDFAAKRRSQRIQHVPHPECGELLHLGMMLGERIPRAAARLEPWLNAVHALVNTELEPWQTEAELDRLAMVLRRLCLGAAHAASDRALRSPRDCDFTATPDGEELPFGYERDIRPETLEARCHDYAPAPAGWHGSHVLFSSGQAAMNCLLLALTPRGANPATPPQVRHIGGYFETEELLAMLAGHGMIRELPKQGDQPADALILEPVYFDRAGRAHNTDVAEALRRNTISTAGMPSLAILDTTLLGSHCDLDALLELPGGDAPAPLLVRLTSGLKLDQAGLELANVGIVSIYQRDGQDYGHTDLTEKLRKARTLTGSGLSFDAIATLEAPWFLDRNTARRYTAAVLDNNARLAGRLAECGGIFSLISHPSLMAEGRCAAAAPYCLLQLHEDSAENYHLLEKVIARESKARNLRFDKGGSFGFRGHRYEAILPQAGECLPFLRVAMGARGGWSCDGIIDMLCDIARAPSLAALT
jgi:hypothetical protein